MTRHTPTNLEHTMTRTNAEIIADLLTAERINWRKVEELGGSIRDILDEAAKHGDDELVAKARGALARRA